MVSKKRRAEKLTNCWNGSDNFAKLQLVKNSRFSGSIKTNHENSHLFLAKKTREKFSEHTSHDESLSTGENTDLKISSTSTAQTIRRGSEVAQSTQVQRKECVRKFIVMTLTLCSLETILE